jgi:RNA polymerase sigma-70 factor (ECF subfamily)
MSTVIVSEPVEPAEPEDFERIFRQYAPLVYFTAWKILGSREDAEDVLQTIFFRLLRLEDPHEFRKNLRAYLNRAAVNASVDILKARRRGPVFVGNTASFENGSTLASGEPFDEAAYCRLYEAIGRLKPRAAEVILLHHMEGKSVAEIAKTLAVSRSVVTVRLFRARARLRRFLEQEKRR